MAKRRSVGLRTLSVIAVVVLLAVAALEKFGRLDARFFSESVPGARALIHYLAGDYGGAARWYWRNTAASIEPRQTSASGALLAGNNQLAESLARQELTQYPDAVAPTLTLAEIALARGQHNEALEHVGRVLKSQPDDYDALLITAVAHARRSEWNVALDTLKRVLRQDRAERRYTVFLAALEVTGDVDDLVNPPLCLLAHLHLYLRMYDPARGDSAAQYAQRAIETGDRADDAWVALAIVHGKEGKRRRALEEFDRAIKLNPSNSAALLGAARLRADRGELAAEYRLLQAAFRATPDDPFVADRFHDLLTRKLGDYRQALAMDETAVAATPEDARAWWRLGDVQSRLGDHEASLRSFGRSVELRDLAEAHEGMGHALRQLQRYDEAAEAYKLSVKADWHRPGPFVGLGVLHARARRYAEALAAYEQAQRLGATQVDHVVELCSLYYQTGKVSRATGCLREVLARDPDNARGRALLEQVQKTAASRRPA